MESSSCCSGGSKMCPVTWLCMVLVMVGAINWGLVGAFEFNLVTYLLGKWPMVERVVYGLVGLSALFMLVKCMLKKGCCSSEGK